MFFDVIVLGTGLAGIYASLHLSSLSDSDSPHQSSECSKSHAALHLSSAHDAALHLSNKSNSHINPNILLLSKENQEDSGSSLAQGGVAAVLDDSEDDSFARHEEDTFIAGNRSNHPDAVRTLVHEGPDDVRQLIHLGVEFDKQPDGRLSRTLEGGHSRRRIVHHADETGKELITKLLSHVRTCDNITLLDHTLATDATALPGGGFQVSVYSETEKKTMEYTCRALLLCTGGLGQVYLNSTNPAVSTGDGIRLAYELGATMQQLSSIQFHPTALQTQTNPPSNFRKFLISEAVRGEGAFLLNGQKKRFLDRYDARCELAPRDVVSRSMMLEARRLEDDHFFLDIRHKDRDFLMKRFPGIYSACAAEGLDMANDIIPIFPCQHYLMGGIQVDLHGRTSIPGLFAAGECACTGLHGGNRLASNSLPEALVFARRSAAEILSFLSKHPRHEIFPSSIIKPEHVSCNIPQIRNMIQTTMQETWFVLPNYKKISSAVHEMRQLYERLSAPKMRCQDTAELRSLACCSMLILEDASK